MKETVAQILFRTAQRWYKIRHLDSETRKHLMSVPEKDFNSELQKILNLVETTTEGTNYDSSHTQTSNF